MSIFSALKVVAKNVFGIQTGERPYPSSSIYNFGTVVARIIFRGSEPERKSEYANLKHYYKIKTVVDLTKNPKEWIPEHCKTLGINYINIPMSDKDYPDKGAVEKILSLLVDDDLYPIYIHCEGGRHRTGCIVACFRIKYEGWSFEAAYREMKKFDWYSEFGHKPLLDFVKDFSKEVGDD